MVSQYFVILDYRMLMSNISNYVVFNIMYDVATNLRRRKFGPAVSLIKLCFTEY